MVNFGSSYSGQTTVRVAAPRNGGDAARVRPVIENGRITALEVIYPGKGYEPGEVVVLLGDDVFIDFPEGSSDERGRGAEAVARGALALGVKVPLVRPARAGRLPHGDANERAVDAHRCSAAARAA